MRRGWGGGGGASGTKQRASWQARVETGGLDTDRCEGGTGQEGLLHRGGEAGNRDRHECAATESRSTCDGHRMSVLPAQPVPLWRPPGCVHPTGNLPRQRGLLMMRPVHLMHRSHDTPHAPATASTRQPALHGQRLGRPPPPTGERIHRRFAAHGGRSVARGGWVARTLGGGHKPEGGERRAGSDDGGRPHDFSRA